MFPNQQPRSGSVHPAAVVLVSLMAIGFVAVIAIVLWARPTPEPKACEPKITPLPSAAFVGIRAGQERDVTLPGNVLLKLLWCPSGEFTMGSPKSEVGRDDFEHNEDQVAVTMTHGFWLGQTEVTQGQWEALMGTRPWRETALFPEEVREGNNFPATYVSSEDAAAFCRTLTKRERGQGRLPANWVYTLPTEAQWEYACRAGTTTRFHFGDDESRFGEHAWFAKNTFDIGEKYAHEVGRKRANAIGLHDMHGNVDEWCWDWYRQTLPGGKNPYAIGGPFRVYRGGSWRLSAEDCRSSSRHWQSPMARGVSLGFRLAAVSSCGARSGR